MDFYPGTGKWDSFHWKSGKQEERGDEGDASHCVKHSLLNIYMRRSQRQHTTASQSKFSRSVGLHHGEEEEMGVGDGDGT